jgi:hypothetical protein
MMIVNAAKYLKYAAIALIAVCLLYMIPAALREIGMSAVDEKNSELIFTSDSPGKNFILKVFLRDEGVLNPHRLLVKTYDKSGNIINNHLFDQNDCEGIAVTWEDLTHANINNILLDVRNDSYDAGKDGDPGCPVLQS